MAHVRMLGQLHAPADGLSGTHPQDLAGLGALAVDASQEQAARAWAASVTAQPGPPAIHVLPQATARQGAAAVAAWLEPLARDAAPHPLGWSDAHDPLALHEARAIEAALSGRAVTTSWPSGPASPNTSHPLWAAGDVDALESAWTAPPPGATAPALPPSHATLRFDPHAPQPTGLAGGRLHPGWQLELNRDEDPMPSTVARPACAPLLGMRVASTHAPVTGRARFVDVLQAMGASGVPLPCLEFTAPADPARLDAAVLEVPARGAILTSAQGVHAFCDALVRQLPPGTALSSHLAGAEIAVIGPRTAHALACRGLAPTVVAAPAHAEGLVATLTERDLMRRPWTLFRADEGRDVLHTALLAAGNELRTVEAYAVRRPEVSAASIAAALLRRGHAGVDRFAIDALCVTSGRAARHLLETLDEHLGTAMREALLSQVALISIGPVTTRALETLGVPGVQTADTPTAAGLVRALVNALPAPTSV